MQDKKLISLILGAMCMVLTFGIALQIRTVQASNTTVSQNYTENNLRAKVLKQKEEYDNKLKDIQRIEVELEKERRKATQNNSNLEEDELKINQGNKLIGFTEVTGPGVIVTLNDGKETSPDPVVHDMDILVIVNELKNAGAEAISINDQRVVPTTAIVCGGNIVMINGERIGAPFVIKAIGLPETLANLSRPNGYLSNLKQTYGIDADLKKSNDITIPKFNGVITHNYMKNM